MQQLSPTQFPSTAVVIPAAGSGARMGAGRNKVWLPLQGEPLLLHTLRLFARHPAVGRMVLVLGSEEIQEMDTILGKFGDWPKLMPLVAGGAERQDSVANGLQALTPEPPQWVLVHDGARPFCTDSLVERVLRGLQAHAAVVPALPIHDTLRRSGNAGTGVVDRNGVMACQTPQGFHWDVLLGAHTAALAEGRRGTDEAELVEAAGVPLFLVEGDLENIKITTRRDLAHGERMAAWRKEDYTARNA